MAKCNLCNTEGPLCDSHTLPAFAVRWLKETSPTPYLRNPVTPNKRLQDIGKSKLLCQSCETLFSKDEKTFFTEIFEPYVTKELDEKGCGQGHIKTIPYEEWLLRFAISIQWRTIVTRPAWDPGTSTLSNIEATWREFLLGRRKDTGRCENHMLFLQSLGGAEIPDGLKLGYRANSYAMRSLDATTVSSSKTTTGIYSKIGPIVFFTPVWPLKLKGNSDSRLHMRGSIKVGQQLKDTELNHFIFIARPNETHRELSEAQKDKIADSIKQNPERALNSMSLHVLETDFRLEKRKGTK